MNKEKFNSLEPRLQRDVSVAIQALINNETCHVGTMHLRDDGTIACKPLIGELWLPGTCLVFVDNLTDTNADSHVIPLNLMLDILPNLGGIVKTPSGWHIPDNLSFDYGELLNVMIEIRLQIP